MLKFTLSQIAQLIEGTVEGNPNAEVTTVCKIEEGFEGGLSFLANPKYTGYIYNTKATAVIVNNDFEPQEPYTTSLIRVKDAYSAFAKLLAYYSEYTSPEIEISSLSFVSKDAHIGKNVYIGEFAVISAGSRIEDGAKIYPQSYIGKNAIVGENSILYPGVKIYANCVIGKSCILHAGAVIGADGFGFAPNNDSYDKIPQIGNVVLQDNVEVGANTCIDKATVGSTVIEKGAKLDNLIQIGHNVSVGRNTVMAAQTGIAGSSKVGNNCMFGGQVGVAGHLHIASGVKLGAQTGVTNNIQKENTIMAGSPAIEVGSFRRSSIHFKNLNDIVKRLNELEKRIGEGVGEGK